MTRHVHLIVSACAVAVFLSGCLLREIRPLGGPEMVKKRDLPSPGRVDGDPVRTFLRPDAIPAVDDPELVPAAEADFMGADEAVLGVVVNGVARAYSLWHLDRHEVVNDVLEGRPIAVTW